MKKYQKPETTIKHFESERILAASNRNILNNEMGDGNQLSKRHDFDEDIIDDAWQTQDENEWE